MITKSLLYSSLGVLLFIALAVLLYTRLEKVEITEWVGAQGEAKANRLYAHRLFLKKMGIPATSIASTNDITQWPNVDTVVFLNTERLTLTQEKLDELLEWVSRGGHLITVVSKKNAVYDEFGVLIDDEYLRDDPLLNYLGIAVQDYVDLYEYLEEDEYELNYWDIQLTNASEPTAVEVYSFKPLKSNDANDDVVKIEDHTFLINKQLGAGMITVLSTFLPFEDVALGDADHAKFFWYLVHSHHSNPSHVWLIDNDDMPSIFFVMWEKAKLLIITLLFLLVASLLYFTNRFGPIVPAPSLNRRQLLEHIQASGYHYWKNNQKILINSERQALHNYLAKKHLGWNEKNQQQRIDFLQERLDIPADKATYLLYENNVYTMDEFTQLIQNLENIKRGL